MDEIERKMIAAYMTATRLQQEIREPILTVAVHVGDDGWEWIRSRAVMPPEETATQPWLARPWMGLPLLRETAWDSQRVEVRVSVTIP